LVVIKPSAEFWKSTAAFMKSSLESGVEVSEAVLNELKFPLGPTLGYSTTTFMLLTLASFLLSVYEEQGGRIASALNSMNSECLDENLKGSSVVLLSLGDTI
jgi:hypothetical protein